MAFRNGIWQHTLAFSLLALIGTVPALAVEFGDNSSAYANDGECDDPRFTGIGVDEILLDQDRFSDANDCRALFESGQITLIAGTKGSGIDSSGIDFGSNGGIWVNDGECDDPRFEGPGSAAELTEDDRMRDAQDCGTLFASGQITMISTKLTKRFDFGNDSSQWSRDGECDDPRFQGTGMATTLLAEDLGRDASDCRSLLNDGLVFLSPGGGGDRISFGDNTSQWSNDIECDDPRFIGTGMATSLLDEDAGHDANDCSTLYFNEQIAVR